MSEKRIYVKGCVGDRRYVDHMTRTEARLTFDSFEEISEAKYHAARADGIQSWYEYETQCMYNAIRKGHYTV